MRLLYRLCFACCTLFPSSEGSRFHYREDELHWTEAWQLSHGPWPCQLPSPLRRDLAAEAKRRGLKVSTTVRVLVSERIREIEEAQELTEVERWQGAQAWATRKKIQAGDRREVSDAEIEAVFERTLARARRGKS